MKKHGNRSQTFTEYAILIAVVAAVLFGMRIYMERAVQQKFRESADVFGEGEQYAKGVTRAIYNDGPGPTPITPPSGKDICPGLLSKIDVLEGEIKDLNERAAAFEQSALNLNNSATDLNAQIPLLREQARQLRIQADGYEAQADAKDADALGKRNQAKALNAQADDKQKEIDDYKKNYPFCFPGGCVSSCADGDNCCCVLDSVANLGTEIASLRSEAALLNAQAAVLEDEAKVLHGKAASLYKAADDADGAADDLGGTQVPRLKEQAKSFQDQAADARSAAQKKEDQIEQLKKDYPKCF
jgi:predicted  nucleic acid-binding Zn-ribbon protein